MQASRWVKRLPLLALIALTLPSLVMAEVADEFSSGDKLRTLYSNHFSFTDEGFPQVTIEIMGGQQVVRLGASGGLVLLPDGEGGARMSGANDWTLRLEDGRGAKVREWTVVERFTPDEMIDSEIAVAKWKKQGHKTQSFEIGTIFAVQGDVLDTREVLVAIDPVAEGKGLEKAREIQERLGLATTVHTELLRRPSGTIVATSGDTEVRNTSVIWFASQKAKSTIEVKDVETGGGGSQAKSERQDRSYFGSVYVTVGRDGKLSVVNAVAADDLLNGLVPSEMFPDAPMEALKAQSVAARTELLQKLGVRHFSDPFLLCASQHCQVYSGAGHEHPRTSAAVKSTRGQVLVTDERKLVDARYSASCGGHTEHNESVWGGEADPVLRGHLDGPGDARFKKGVTDENVEAFLAQDDVSYCAKTKYSKGRHRWTASIDAETLSKQVAQSFPGVGRVQSLEPVERGVSGRITKLRVQGDRGGQTVEGELTIRRLLGGLRSSLFTTQTKGSKERPSSFEFHGAGFGHGVGMCQVGAIGMAQSGSELDAILSHYYGHSSLHRLY